jgi:ABC-type transporter Mla maintaining outer membrane lipid asymmetry permease subunit MlaE
MHCNDTMLTVLTDIVGVLGGAVIAYTSLGIGPESYFTNILQNIGLSDFLSGLSKSFFFGAEIAVISCHSGFSTSGGAAGVDDPQYRQLCDRQWLYLYQIISLHILSRS